jgi:hypothetical protein
LPPGQLTEYATVFISVIDVNEAPYWLSSSLVTCPYVSSGNSYSTSIARFPTSALYSACVYVTETALAGAISGAFISSASDFDTLWLSSNGAPQSMLYSFASTPSNVYRAPDQYIFSVDAISRQISLLVNGRLTFDFETQNMLNLTASCDRLFNSSFRLFSNIEALVYVSCSDLHPRCERGSIDLSSDLHSPRANCLQQCTSWNACVLQRRCRRRCPCIRS